MPDCNFGPVRYFETALKLTLAFKAATVRSFWKRFSDANDVTLLVTVTFTTGLVTTDTFDILIFLNVHLLTLFTIYIQSTSRTWEAGSISILFFFSIRHVGDIKAVLNTLDIPGIDISWIRYNHVLPVFETLQWPSCYCWVTYIGIARIAVCLSQPPASFSHMSPSLDRWYYFWAATRPTPSLLLL